MKRRMILAAVSGVLGIAAFAQAGAVDPGRVSKAAKFVVHVDLEAARALAVGQRLIDRLTQTPEYAEFDQMMNEAAGFAPASDITGVTIWSDSFGPDPKSVIVVAADVDRHRLANALTFADQYRTETRGKREIISFLDKKKGTRTQVAFLDDKTFLISDDRATLERGLDVADDPKQSLAGDERALPVQTGEGAWAFVATGDISQAPDAAANPVLSQLGTGRLEVAQSAEAKTTMRATVNAKTAGKGPQLLQLARGLKSLAELSLSGAQPAAANPLLPLLPELLAATTIDGTGDQVTANATLPDARAIEMADAAVEAMTGQKAKK